MSKRPKGKKRRHFRGDGACERNNSRTGSRKARAAATRSKEKKNRGEAPPTAAE